MDAWGGYISHRLYPESAEMNDEGRSSDLLPRRGLPVNINSGMILCGWKELTAAGTVQDSPAIGETT
jgi:hypothetical protein